jgi:asparagine synthase (glutamine-hydrolysing)
MCGIAGIVDFSGRTPALETIRAMIDQQRHRGPDGEGILRRDAVALGHRRLSIIDVAGGAQPLSNETQDIWLTFNGEIYNFRELRSTLEASGHTFRCQSDSEVIVHAYEQWGDDCVRHLRGMFAFAIADFRRRRLLLARDHFGIKPLFFRLLRDSVAFASELAPLVDNTAGTPNLNCQALDYYLRYRYIPAPHTIYDEVVRLPPAHTWSCTFAGDARPPREYYRLRMCPDESLDDEAVAEQFAEVLDESVAAHLVSDVPFGAFLSGGVDSTLIVAAMAQRLGGRVQAFSIGFDENDYSELHYARQAAQQLGVELHSEIVTPDVVTILQELFAHYGEPFADTSAIPTWCVARLARRHVPMVLSGDGADEAFAGYTRYDAWVRDTLPRNLARFTRQPRRAMGRAAGLLLGQRDDRLRRWQRDFIGIFRDEERQSLWHDDLRAVTRAPNLAFHQADREARGLRDLQYAQYLDLKTYLPGDILSKVDVAAMCHGLEARTPFADLRVMEFAARLPERWRRQTIGGRASLKVLPKHHLARQFPAAFVHRRKQGFAIPEAAWLRRGTPVRACFDDVVASAHAAIRQYFQPAEIERRIRQFDETGRQPTNLWLLLILGLWLEHRRGASVQLAA